MVCIHVYMGSCMMKFSPISVWGKLFHFYFSVLWRFLVLSGDAELFHFFCGESWDHRGSSALGVDYWLGSEGYEAFGRLSTITFAGYPGKEWNPRTGNYAVSINRFFFHTILPNSHVTETTSSHPTRGIPDIIS